MNRVNALLYSLLLVTPICMGSPWEVVRTCLSAHGAVITLLSQDTIDGNRFGLRFDEEIVPAFSENGSYEVLGTLNYSACRHQVLIFDVSYGPPYRKGVVVRINAASGQRDRIDFAERAKPKWLYLNKSRMKLVIPNIGIERKGKYLIYDSAISADTELSPLASDKLPDRRGYTVLNL